MKMETFLRLPPPLSPPVIPGIVVDDDDVFIATLLDSRVRRVSLQIFFEKRCLLFCEKKNQKTKKHTKLQKKCDSYMHKR